MTISITPLYAGILGLLLVALSIRVVAVVRAKGEVGYGDGGNSDFTTVVRGQGNFIEYVPHALILMALAELNGASATMIHGLGIALVVARLAHPIGLTTGAGVNPFRLVGTSLTWIVIAVASIVAIMGYLG